MMKKIRPAVLGAVLLLTFALLLPLGAAAASDDYGFGLEINTSDVVWQDGGQSLDTYTVSVQYRGAALEGVQSVMMTFDTDTFVYVPYSGEGDPFTELLDEPYEGQFTKNRDWEEDYYKLKDPVAEGRTKTDEWVENGIAQVVSYAELNGRGYIYLIIKQNHNVTYDELVSVCSVRLAKKAGAVPEKDDIRLATTAEANSLNASCAASMATVIDNRQDIYTYRDTEPGDLPLPAPVYSGNAGLGIDAPAGTVTDKTPEETTEKTPDKQPAADAVALSAPSNLTWVNNTATWNAVEGASAYRVQLYKNGTAVGDPITVTATSCSFASQITETGNYSFTVTAVGDGAAYTDSGASTQSGTNAFSSESDQDTFAVSAAVAGILGGRRRCDNSSDPAAKTAQVQKYVSDTVASIPRAAGVLTNVEYKSGNTYIVTFTRGHAIEEKEIDVIFEPTLTQAERRAAAACDTLTAADAPLGVAVGSADEATLERYLTAWARVLVPDTSLGVQADVVQIIPPSDGADGRCLYTVTVTEGKASSSTTRLTLAIRPDEGSSSARSAVGVADAVISCCSGIFDLPFGYTPEDQADGALAYVLRTLSDDRRVRGVAVSLERLTDDTFNVTFTQDGSVSSCEMTVFPNVLPDPVQTAVDAKADALPDEMTVQVPEGADQAAVAEAVTAALRGEDDDGTVGILSEVTGTEDGRFTVKVTFARGTVTRTETVRVAVSYLSYLTAPVPVSFTGGHAVWQASDGADGYNVQLYKNGFVYGKPCTTTTTEYDFTGVIFARGTYTFTVTAVGRGRGDSRPSAESSAYLYTQAIDQLTDTFAYLHGLPARTYQVKVTAGEGGSVDPAVNQTVKEGYNKTVVITPARGYKIGDVKVDGRSIGAVSMHVFCAVTADHTIEISFKRSASLVLDEADWVNPFTDVSEKDSYYKAIRFVNANGLFLGTTTTTFGPDVTMTRAMFVTVLGRLSGVDVSAYSGEAFTDLVKGEYYCPYVAWASENELILGYGDGRFGPGDTITHEQMYVIMKRYADLVGVGAYSDQTVLRYSDADAIHDWAINAVKYCKAKDMIEIAADGVLDPTGNARRCEVATVLYRFCRNVLN